MKTGNENYTVRKQLIEQFLYMQVCTYIQFATTIRLLLNKTVHEYSYLCYETN